jgi:hypothetical protein
MIAKSDDDFFQLFLAKQVSHDLWWIYINALLNEKGISRDVDKRIKMSLCVLCNTQSLHELESCNKEAICLSEIFCGGMTKNKKGFNCLKPFTVLSGS